MLINKAHISRSIAIAKTRNDKWSLDHYGATNLIDEYNNSYVVEEPCEKRYMYWDSFYRGLGYGILTGCNFNGDKNDYDLSFLNPEDGIEIDLEYFRKEGTFTLNSSNLFYGHFIVNKRNKNISITINLNIDTLIADTISSLLKFKKYNKEFISLVTNVNIINVKAEISKKVLCDLVGKIFTNATIASPEDVIAKEYQRKKESRYYTYL